MGERFLSRGIRVDNGNEVNDGATAAKAGRVRRQCSGAVTVHCTGSAVTLDSESTARCAKEGTVR